MILVHQRYFAKAHLEETVLSTRVEASRRLAELGVPAGRIWVPVDGPGGAVRQGAPALPDVVWECTYPSLEERERIRSVQEADPAFHAIRTRQGSQLSHWAREHYRLWTPA